MTVKSVSPLLDMLNILETSGTDGHRVTRRDAVVRLAKAEFRRPLLGQAAPRALRQVLNPTRPGGAVTAYQYVSLPPKHEARSHRPLLTASLDSPPSSQHKLDLMSSLKNKTSCDFLTSVDGTIILSTTSLQLVFFLNFSLSSTSQSK